MANQYREIVKHSIVYGAGGILARAVGFLMIPVYTKYLTPGDYGVIELLDTFFMVLGILVNMGINMSVFKFYYSYEREKDKKQVISTAIILTFAISSIFTIFGIFNLKSISTLLFQSNAYTSYIRIILLTFLFDNINNILLSFVRVQQKSLLYSVISIIRLFLGLSLNIYLIVFKGMGVFGVLYSSLISSCVGAFFLGFYTVREIGVRFSLRNAKEMLRYGLPLVPSSIGMFLIHFGDRFFLQRYSDLTELGLYSLAYKFGFLINVLIVLPFSLIWDAKMFEIEKKADAKNIYSRVFTYFIFILIFSSTMMTILIKDVMPIIVAKEYFKAHKIVPFIAFAYVLNGCCYMLRTGFYLRKKTEYVGIIMMITTVFTLIMYYIFIPPMGAMGAALSTLLSFIFWNGLTYVISQRVYKIYYEWGRIMKLCLASLLIILISHLIHFDRYQINLVLKSFITFSFPFILFTFNFYQQTELASIKRAISKLNYCA